MARGRGKNLPSRAEVLDVIGQHDRPLHAREIASRLGVEEGDYLGLQRLLDELSFEGVLASRPGQRFKLSKKSEGDRQKERQGILTINPRGFGFVAALENVGDDVFIPPDALAGAMHGDTVIVRVTARGSRGAEGEIVRVVERGVTRVAGTLRRRGGRAWLEPDDPRVRGPIALTANLDVRGPEGNSGTDGDAVIATITRFPDFSGEQPEGRLEAVLGRPGELSVEVAKILLLEKIEEVHSDAAIDEARAYGDEVAESLKEGREDLTHLPLPTIDPEDARDHDDAVWVERSDGGGYRAWIAIADVSAYVTPGTALDKEAMARGCSVYLPDRAIPMLPRALSSNLCSLLPDVDRLCLCVAVELDGGGSVIDYRLIRGVMKSRAKLTYGGVARALGLSDVPKREPLADEMVDGLRVAYELSRLLRGKRMKRGAIDFDLPEAKVVLDEDRALPLSIERRAQDPGMKRAYQLIEELMLLANETVARWAEEQQTPAIYRVHAPPDEKKLERFAAMCDVLGIPFDVEETKEPKLLSALLKRFSEHPLANVLNNLLLRSMKQATYDVANIGHFGLASKAYLHFTSPIRRYPDLVVHRNVHAMLQGRRVRRGGEAEQKMAEAALASSVAERRAMEVERAVVDLYRAFLMRERIGERFEGTVSAVVGSGVFVALDAPFVDVLVRLEDLGQDSWEVDDDGLKVVARRSGEAVSLGDRIVLEIVDVSMLRRSVYGRRVGGEAREHDRGRDHRKPARREDRRQPAKPSKKVDRVLAKKMKQHPKKKGSVRGRGR